MGLKVRVHTTIPLPRPGPLSALKEQLTRFDLQTVSTDGEGRVGASGAVTTNVVGFRRGPGVRWQAWRAVAYRCCMRPSARRRQRTAGPAETWQRLWSQH